MFNILCTDLSDLCMFVVVVVNPANISQQLFCLIVDSLLFLLERYPLNYLQQMHFCCDISFDICS